MLHDPGTSPPTRLLLLRDGDIGWAGLDGYMLDKDAAKRIVEHFSEMGNKLLIDWEHADSEVRKGRREKAPAAGWIGNLEYVEGEGLYGTVSEWTGEAAALIRQHAYKYISPVIIHDDDKAIQSIESVALTNTPRTKYAPELAHFDHTEMPKMKRITKKLTRLAAKDGDDPKPIEVGPADGLRTLAARLGDYPAILADQKAISNLLTAVKAKGVEVSDDVPLADLLAKAIELLSAQGKLESGDVQALAAKLGCANGDLKKIGDEVSALKIKAASYDAVAKEVAELREERETARIDSLVDAAVKAGRLNPNDKEQIAAARSFAKSDEKSFTALVGSLVPSASVTRITGSSNGKNGSDRKQIVTKAKDDYWNNPLVQRQCKAASFVNVVLREHGLPVLTDDELKSVEVN